MNRNYIVLLMEGSTDKTNILYQFYMNPLSRFEEELYKDEVLEKVSELVVNLLMNTSIEEILDIIELHKTEIEEITTSNIPQFSSIEDLDKIPAIVETNRNCDYTLIGYYFNKDANSEAQRKYGENHYKADVQLGLVKEGEPYEITAIGRIYMNLPEEDKSNLKAKLCLRVPIIQYNLTFARRDKMDGMKILRTLLKESTAIRRRSSIKNMIRHTLKYADKATCDLINNNISWE